LRARISVSETHCEQEICVLKNVKEQVDCKNCPSGQECGRIHIDRYFRSKQEQEQLRKQLASDPNFNPNDLKTICVPKYYAELIHPTWNTD
jgi:hypothetical protein